MTRKLVARDAMSHPVKTLQRDQSLDEAVKFLTREGIGGAPVLDAHGAPVGVVSAFDIMAYLAGLELGLGKLGGFYLRSALRWDGGDDEREAEDEPLFETRVDEVMTPDLLNVPADLPLDDVMAAFVQHRVHRLLVVEGEELVGIVTTLDVMRALTS